MGDVVNAYISDMNFHHGSELVKFIYSLKTIYFSEI